MNHESANDESRIANDESRISRFTFHVSRLTSKTQNPKFKILPLACILLALIAAAPLWGPGMVNTRGGGDSPFLLQRTLDMAENLRYGIFPPRWMAHAAYDLGYPMFNHYAALPYYLSGGLAALGISPLVAIQATQTLGFVLAALAMALWAGRIYRSQAATLLSVAAYTFAPFHLVNVYVRGDSLSEFYAFVWYPLILWSLERLAERPTRRRIVAAALAYGALILTHNVSALIFAPFALLYAVARMANRESADRRIGESANRELRITSHEFHVSRFLSKIRNLKSKIPLPISRFLRPASCILLPFLLAFMLTAWFWAPAILETKYGQMGSEFTEGYFHYSHHFRGWNLVQPSLAFNYGIAIRTEDAGPFAMGLVQTGLAAVGAGLLTVSLVKSQIANRKSQIANRKLQIANRKSQGSESAEQRVSESASQRISPPPLSTVYRLPSTHLTFHVSRFLSTSHQPPAIFILFSLFLSTLMITRFSRPLWDHLPLLEMTQFPWRFLSVQALFTAIVTGAIGECRPRRGHEYTNSGAANQRGSGLASQRASESVRERVGESSPRPSLPSTVYCLPISRFTFHVSRFLSTIHHPLFNFTLCISLLLLIIAAALFSLHPERLLIDDADVTWENLLFYETFTGNIGTTIRYEYLPRDVNPRPYISESVVDGFGRAIANGAPVNAIVLQRAPNRQIWQMTLAQAAPTTFPLNWWPGWQAEVDGANAEAYPMPGSGRLTVNLPAGAHTVTLSLHNTPLRTAANLASALTVATLWILDFGFWILERRHLSDTNRKSQIAIRKSQIAIRYSLFAICLLALCLFFPLALHGGAQAPAAFFDFHSAPYPHAGPVIFDVGRLETVTQSVTTAQPGETLTITHTWTLNDGAAPITGTLRLVSPAEPRHGIAVTLAEAPFTLVRSATYPTTLRLPDDLSRGLYLIELSLNGPQPSAVYVGAVRIPQGPTRRTDAPVLAEFRDLTLHNVTVTQPEQGKLNVKLAWSTIGTPRNWSLSLRVLDADGRLLAQQDQETHGYGYLPTTLWSQGELVTDYAVLHLTTPPPGDYTLRVITYLRATSEGGGEIDIPIRLTDAIRYNWQAHTDVTPQCQTDRIALLEVSTPGTVIEGRPFEFSHSWHTLITPTGAITVTWTLIAPDATEIATQRGPISPGARPEIWPQHTFVWAQTRLDLPPTLPIGDYRLRVTIEDNESTPASCDLPLVLPLTPRSRNFTAPDPATPMATFSDTLRLLSYGLEESRDKITLTLWWQAVTPPGRDYKRFIHVFDPTTEAIVAQDDAMPRAWSYPTSLWVAGEVVSETVTFDMSPVTKGRYRIAVGWYDPESPGTRLPARDAEGQPALLDRAVLDHEITHF